ncbi:hypothetical protein [Pseudoalteromonas luteoviolacea]|uniref:Uncharacterized protein n=1 Tax=Pseudoalteromonas luteoviolacea S4060-1 TaxID=1365257 RepID=A0A162BB68_9GAMM|nr:hypothetical protein [Pseudoalteromonas luteoviolacea]KZN69463.1 hypothetical protein N478_12585 [Pseudoalteromonas luteoviolacea S4060-1]
MTWFSSSNANATNGSNIIKINDNQSVANIRASDALVLGAFAPIEIAKAYVTTHGTFIELIKPWPNATQSQVPCVVLPTSGDFNTAVSALNNASKMVNDNYKAMIEWQTNMGTVQFINLDGHPHTVKTLKQMQADITAIAPYPDAMSQVQFDTLRQHRKHTYKASGFCEFGISTYPDNVVHSGLATRESEVHALYLGNNATVVIDGVQFTLSATHHSAHIKAVFEPAPNGTQTFDEIQSTYIQHSTPEVAFASETPNSKVIKTRQDVVLLVKRTHCITTSDTVYPFANLRFGGSRYLGSVVNDHKHIWSSLPPATQRAYLAEPKNNIRRLTDGRLVQDTIELMTITGFGDQWDNTETGALPWQSRYLGYGNETPQYIQADTLAFGPNHPLQSDKYNQDVGLFANAERTVFAIPVAIVQRMNRGVFHPVHNPFGCATSHATLNALTSALGTFVHIEEHSGTLESGRSGALHRYKYHDVIYADQIQDVRLNVGDSCDFDKAAHKAVSGQLRGKSRMPYTRTTQINSVSITGNDPEQLLIRDDSSTSSLFKTYGTLTFSQAHPIFISTATGKNLRVCTIGSDSTGDYFYVLASSTEGLSVGHTICYHDFSTLTAEFNSVPSIDVVTTPASLAQSFPHGIAGLLASNTTDDSVRFNQKCLGATASIINEATLSSGAPITQLTVDDISNQISTSTNALFLCCYESPAAMTKMADNFAIESHRVHVVSSSTHDVHYGNRLMTSLTNQVGLDPNRSNYAVYSMVHTMGIDANWKTSNIQGRQIDHSPLKLAPPANGDFGFKSAVSLVKKNGLFYLQFNAISLKYSSNNWGDNSLIYTVNGASKITDTNGNEVDVVCHHSLFPIGVG